MADRSRRDFVKSVVGGAAVTGMLLPEVADAFSLNINSLSGSSDNAFSSFFRRRSRTVREQVLSLHNLHTGERLNDVCFYERGRFNRDALREINYLLRDHRSGDVTQIDTDLLKLLVRVQEQVGSSSEFQVISAYRSPKTNEMLRARGKGVAKSSYHTKGQAIDIRLPDRDLRDVKKVALNMGEGGVGYYSRSGFVHLDTGRVRSWTS